MADEIVAAARGRIGAPQRAAQGDWLASDDGPLRLADDLGILVGHPAHDHRVGGDVARGDIAIPPDGAGAGLDVGSRQAFKPGLGEVSKVYLNGALSARVGQGHAGALEGYPK